MALHDLYTTIKLRIQFVVLFRDNSILSKKYAHYHIAGEKLLSLIPT